MKMVMRAIRVFYEVEQVDAVRDVAVGSVFIDHERGLSVGSGGDHAP